MALRLHRPNEALRALAQVDPEKGFLRGWDGFWGYPMQAHLMLGQLDQALTVAREGRRRYPDSRQAVHQEVTVLAAMGKEADVNRLLKQFAQLRKMMKQFKGMEGKLGKMKGLPGMPPGFPTLRG